MKALVFENQFDAAVKDVPKPSIENDQALLKILACGICGGDIHFYGGTHPYSHYPQINGHEAVGTIEKLPEGRADFAPGDRVVPEILIPCGKCYPCRHDKPNCCSNLKVFGIHVPGGFAEYAAVPVKNLHKVPDNLSLDEAVLTEPYSIAHHVVTRSGINSDETALVIGAGTIGLTVTDILKTKGVTVIVADISEFRLEKARAVGADITVNSSKRNLEEEVMKNTDGEGAGFIFEATGVPKVMESTIDLAAAGGTVMIVGLTNEAVSFSGKKITGKELTIKGSRNAYRDFGPVLELMSSGRLHQSVLLTKKIPVAESATEIEGLYRDASNEIKAAIFFE
ncbi:MAG: zinc-binding alcohol dehydrogenase family protein [Synergistaceae bacterium]|nr:zinc-binding alcohol dehydrogenase family protein [Synergistaceae bacterium]